MGANQSQEQIKQIIESKFKTMTEELKTMMTEESNKLYQIIEELQSVQTKLPTEYALETFIVLIADHFGN